jgi:hypothetical protein
MKSLHYLTRLNYLTRLRARHDKTKNHAHVPLPLVWYIKWVASIVLIIAIILSSNNMYPYYMYVQSVGIALWLVVSFIWNDKALIVVNSIGLTLIVNGIVKYLT